MACLISVGSILGTQHELKTQSAARMAQQIANLHDGWRRVGAQLVPGATASWSVTSFVPSSIVLLDSKRGHETPRVLGRLTLERANTPLTSGTKTLTIVLPVIIDLETLDTWIDHAWRPKLTPSVDAAVFGKMLRGIIDSAGVQATGGSMWEIDTSATNRIDAPPAGSLSHDNVLAITMREKHSDPTRPANAIHVTIRSGGSRMEMGFTVRWEVAGHTMSGSITEPKLLRTAAGAGFWYSMAMLAKILPELSTIASWLNINDQTHDLHIDEASTTKNDNGGFIILKIIDTTSTPTPNAQHFLGFDTADMVGNPARPQVWYHGQGAAQWSKLDKDNGNVLFTLATALAKIRP